METCGRDRLRQALASGAAPEVWVRFPRQLGDVVFSLPFFGTLQEDWNRVAREAGHDLKWIAVGHDIGASIFSDAHPSFISESHIEQKGRGKMDPWRLAARWRERRPAAILNLSQSVRLGLAAWMAGVPLRAGDVDNHLGFLYHYRFSYREHGSHLAIRFGRLLEALTGSRTMRYLPLSPDRIGGRAGMDLLRSLGWSGEPYVALAFGTRVANKRWFPEEETWPRLARRLMDDGFRIVWLGGPDEAPLGARLAGLVPGSLDATGRTSIPEACAIQYHAYGTVAVDTGLAHTSAATGRPTVTLFGPTIESYVSPQGPHALTLRPPAVDVAEGHGWDSENGTHRLEPGRVARLLHLLADEAAQRTPA